MHYNKSPMLRFFNALFEFILLVVVFIIAGALRSVSPIGSRFFMWDVWAFLPIAGLYALVNVACYVVEGCYRSLHSQNKMRQLFQIGVTNLVGLGAPKQERWMAVHEDRVQALMVGVGAAFDYEAGNIRRAPQWMQKHNLEWLYRLMQDPKRLFKRYFVTNTKYLWWTWRQ